MTPFVILFFLHNVLATILLGFQFGSKQEPVFKYFGFGLLLDSVAFAIWSAAVIFKPADLETFVMIGALFFIASLVAFFAAAIQHVSPKKRNRMLIAASVLGVAAFLTRTLVYMGNPGFSAEGLFFFNLHPVMQVVYVFALALAVLPAIDAVATRIKDPVFSNLVRYGFIIEVIGGIMLMMSTDLLVLTLSGCLISFTYFALWMMSFGRAKAWKEVV